MSNAISRPDQSGKHEGAFKKNKKIILATQDVCGICGRLVDKSLPSSDPLGPTIDHIIPIAAGGHPSALDNLQLAHRCCNQSKKDKILTGYKKVEPQIISNRVLPQTCNWAAYKPI